MSKDYQKKTARTSTTAELVVPVVPDVVSVAMTEIVADVREGLLAMAVGAGPGGDGRDDGHRRGRVVRAAGRARPGSDRYEARE